MRRVVVAAALVGCAGLSRPARPAPNAWPAPSDGADRYGEWTVDVASVEGRGEPLVFLGESPGAGTGVFAAERLEAGQTITEFVGCLAPTPATRCDEMELQQSFYGSDWRTYSQRYEIGLSGAKVADAGGTARGGVLVDDDVADERGARRPLFFRRPPAFLASGARAPVVGRDGAARASFAGTATPRRAWPRASRARARATSSCWARSRARERPRARASRS